MSKHDDLLLKSHNNLNVVNKFRSSLNLPNIIVKDRSCLKCNKIFTSESINHRLCYDCNKVVLSSTTGF